MKKLLTLFIALLLSIPLLAKGGETDTSFSQIISGSCVLEDVAIVGIIHTSSRTTALRDGGIRIDITDRTKGEGTGLSSGIKYNVSGRTTQRFIISSEELESYTYKSGFTLIGPGPDNNLTITYIFRQTTEGVVVDSFLAQCK